MDFKRFFFFIGAGLQLGVLVMMILFMQEMKKQQESFSEDIFEDFILQKDIEENEPFKQTISLNTKEERSTGFIPTTCEVNKGTHENKQKTHYSSEETSIVNLPFAHHVSATGKTMPSTNYVQIHAKQPGILKKLYVTEGQRVKKGEPLFKTDDSALLGKLRRKEARCQVARAKLEKLQARVTPADLKKKERDIEELRIKKREQEKECEIFQMLFKQDAVTAVEKAEKETLLRQILANLEKQSIEYESMKSGPSKEEKGVILAEIFEKEADYKALQEEIEGCRVTAPISARVLEIRSNEGQFIASSEQPVVVLGDDSNLHLHVRLGEEKAWRIIPHKKLRAVAVHKSNPNIHFALKFVRIRPCLKRENKTKESNLELIFAFQKGDNPVYLGEVFDVFIEATNSSDTSCLDYKFSNFDRAL